MHHWRGLLSRHPKQFEGIPMFTRIRRTLTTLSLAAAGVAAVTAASAQTVRYVSANGDNANACTREAPCRTLQRGINATPAGGEVQILNPGAYGNAVTIGKSITISAVGVSATVGKITIDAPGATVALRGLLLNGRSVPIANGFGIAITNAETVHIAGCEIERFPIYGILITADNAEFVISDTVVRGNDSHGLLVFGGTARLTIQNSRFENNGERGIDIAGSDAAVAIIGVVASGNGGNGITATAGRMSIASTTAANNVGAGFAVIGAQMTVKSSVVSGNGGPGFVVSGGVGRASNSVFTNNNVGLSRIAGTLESRGNNTVRGNVTSQTQGTITPIPGI